MNGTIPPDHAPAVAAGIRALENRYLDEGGTWSAGIWLPDRQSCEPVSTVAIKVVEPDGPQRMSQADLVRWANKPPRTKGVRYVQVGVSPGNLTAGPAVFQILETVTRPSRRVMLQMNWFVLPPGTEQIVLCQFDSEHPELTDAIGWQTNVVTDTLAVHLTESQATA
ncbi:hypothetical protein ACTHAM_001352 [Cellulomonas soli]